MRPPRAEGASGASGVGGLLVELAGPSAPPGHAGALLHAAPDAYCAVDDDLHLTFANPRACADAGRPAAALLGSPLADLGADGLVALVQRARSSGRVVREEQTSPTGRPCEAQAVPFAGGVGLWWRDVDALVTERRARRAAEAAHAVAARQASSDPLTGLANRAELSRRLAGHLARDGRAATVLFCDLDRFKAVNDTLGHAAGDELLVTVADRLRQLVRATDVVARLGGDEFVLALLDDDPDAAAAVGEEVAARVLAALREPVAAAGRTVEVSASVGVAVAPAHTSAESVLAEADVALYRTKAAGRDGVTWFDEHLRRQLLDRVQLEVDLREAPAAGQLALDYQPCVDLRSGAVSEVEALLRWHHPARGRLGPAQAVPLAEETGLIVPVGAWVLERAVADAARWAHLEPFTTWVNASPAQLTAGFTDALLHRLAAADVPPWRFGVEVTEPALAQGGGVEEEVARLSASGIRVAVDDFGTGYSSLARLARFPVDVLKLDRSFTAGALSRRGRAVLAGVVTLGHAIGARVVAEGVEAPEELDALREAGCDGALGYLLGRPGPAAGVPTGRLASASRPV